MKKRQRTPRVQKVTLAEVEALKNKGLNQSEIAEVKGVTKQYISWLVHTYNGRLTPRQVALRNFPWQVSDIFTRSTIYKNLRHHAEYIATGGVGMPDTKLSRLRGFYRKLRQNNWVIEFDPDNPPKPGVSSVGGFTYIPRTPEDGESLVRFNEYSKDLDSEAKRLWRFPRTEP
ncbi:helix-turn-helix domain-containing protein [Mycolicibacterium sp.]|uniref:helix-turn-helix domain-containing protein n=1 Tax=Mycolicibacterium sp. TaxID=2320850 RepID=UPI003D14B0C2